MSFAPPARVIVSSASPPPHRVLPDDREQPPLTVIIRHTLPCILVPDLLRAYPRDCLPTTGSRMPVCVASMRLSVAYSNRGLTLIGALLPLPSQGSAGSDGTGGVDRTTSTTRRQPIVLFVSSLVRWTRKAEDYMLPHKSHRKGGIFFKLCNPLYSSNAW